MTKEENEAIDWLKSKPQECTNLINSCSYIGNKKTYAKERTMFKILLNLIQNQQSEKEQLKAELEKKDKIINEIQEEVRDHIGFKNRLERDNREPDLFNQGRFYVADNINDILKNK